MDAGEATVGADADGTRLDRYLLQAGLAASRGEAQRLIDLGLVTVGGVAASRHAQRVQAGDSIHASAAPAMDTSVRPQAIPLDVVYEDADVMVIDKPRGMPVHPGPGWAEGTVANAALGHAGSLSEEAGQHRPGIVHRLDRDTGGLMLIARTPSAHRALADAIAARTVERTYTALVWGAPSWPEATVEAPIARAANDRQRMAITTASSPAGRPAITHLAVRERFGSLFALLDVRLETGRTHQVRVHCAYIRHPVVGDPVYGSARSLESLPARERPAVLAALARLGGQALHATGLTFRHPRTGAPMTFSVNPAPPMAELIDLLREMNRAD